MALNILFLLCNNQLIGMAESLSPIKSRTISNSLSKLNRAASDGRFRIKSMRVKTVQTLEQQKCATDRDYQGDLVKKMYTKEFLKKLYISRSEEAQLKISDPKYNAFLRSLHQRIINTTSLCLSSCNFQKNSGEMFLKQFIKLNRECICYDLSKCTYIEGYTPKSANQWIVQNVIRNDRRVVQLILKNMGLVAQDIKRLFDLIVETQKIYELDISNQNSQSMNRISQDLELLFQFCKANPVCSILRLQNLNIRKQGVQQIQKGISANLSNPLKILNLKNNAITQQASLYISLIVRSGLIQLDLSQNPLGPKFYLNLPSWKLSTLRKLNLSSTEMNSECLIYFLSRLEENKVLQILKLDQNDFSSHWFNQIKEILEVNSSIQSLSFVGCQIKRFSDAFVGLFNNRHLKKLNISLNLYEEGVKQLCQMLKINKSLTQLKMRGCGLKPDNFVKIFQAFASNIAISSLDISENQVGQLGGKQILKALNKNNALSYLGNDKSQIPYTIRQQIEQKTNANRDIKKARELAILKKQNKIVKQQDVYTWQDVEDLESKVKTNQKNILSLTSKVTGLEKQYDQKRIRFNEIVKQCGEKQQKLSTDIANLLKQMRKIEQQQKNLLKKYKAKQDNLQNACESEEKQISNLEIMIKEQSAKNKARQNQLEDQYQNFKYIQKKNQGKRQASIKKFGFDTSTAVNSKRKSKNNV